MNTQKYLLASFAAFVVVSVLEFIINGPILGELYRETASIWRPNMQEIMGLFFVAYAVLALVFTFIYTKGYEKTKGKGTVMQGVRFGFYIGLLMALPSSLIWYVVLPIPAVLAVAWFIGGMVEALAAGAAVGAVYRA